VSRHQSGLVDLGHKAGEGTRHFGIERGAVDGSAIA
jgi:hypothetical protein